jgi:hypothetical protein
VERNGGHGGYRRLVEGCANAIQMDRALPRPRALKECAGVVTRRRRCKENIKSKSTRDPSKRQFGSLGKQVTRGCHVIALYRNFTLFQVHRIERTSTVIEIPAIPFLYASTPSWALLGIFLERSSTVYDPLQSGVGVQ